MNKKRVLKYFLFYVFTIISSIVAVILVMKFYPAESKVITETINKSIISENGIEDAISGVYDAVVTVESYSNGALIGTGSGFVYKKDEKVGYILTNNHVIKSGNSFDVILQNGESVEAKLLGSDEYSDLAVLAIDEKNVIKVATLGDSDFASIGNTVFTVGSPMGSDYSGSVTRGIVSGKDRTVESDGIITKVIQTDAAINPGNSGGPLVNLAGEVIGITSIKLASTSIEGMGFAIPINDVKVFVVNLEKGETISRPSIGISLINASERYKLYFSGININNNITEGAVVSKVYSNSAASNSGLQVGDVIIKMDDNKIDSISKLRYYLYQYKIGDKVNLTVIRGSNEINIEIELEGN